MSENRRYTLVLTGGGTAGHVWPHFALFDSGNSPLAQLFKEDKLDVHYFGSQSGMERDLVQKNMPKWTYHPISTGKLRRYFTFQNFLDPFKIIIGLFQAYFLFGKIKPNVVFSKGGFVSAPVVWAAWLRRVPVIIHESDATVALTTKLTLFFCKKALFSFPQTWNALPNFLKHKCIEIGVPLRASLFNGSKVEALNFFGFKKDIPIILIFGGSMGARGVNEKMFAIMDKLAQKYQIIHIVGKGNKNDNYNYPNYRQFEFINQEMSLAYAAADLAICRAGASSIFELAAARIPMILIPLGTQASRGDQIVNAQIFSKNGWAQWYEEHLFTNGFALEKIESALLNLSKMKDQLSGAPSKDSATKVAHILKETMDQEINYL